MAKIKGPKYDTMKNAIKAVVEHYGGAQHVKQVAEEKKLSQMRMLWDLWNCASDNLKFDDSTLMFRLGKRDRIIPPNPQFDVYSDGCNDNHIDTALKCIGKELGVI